MSNIEVGAIFISKNGYVKVTGVRDHIHHNNNIERFVDYVYLNIENGGAFHGSCPLYIFNEKFKAKCKNTRLARKLYPDAEVSECGEWIYV